MQFHEEMTILRALSSKPILSDSPNNMDSFEIPFSPSQHWLGKTLSKQFKPSFKVTYLSGYKTVFFGPLEWLQITKSVLWNFAIIPILPFLDNPKDLDPSYKMDLDLWDCFGRKKTSVL